MESFLNNTTFIFWSAVVLIVVVPGVTSVLAHYWFRTRKAELDAQLKSQMVQLGMSAAEIERVINSGAETEEEEE